MSCRPSRPMCASIGLLIVVKSEAPKQISSIAALKVTRAWWLSNFEVGDAAEPSGRRDKVLGSSGSLCVGVGHQMEGEGVAPSNNFYFIFLCN